ncbi:phosphatidylserine decarboxylase-domain-containing protein [Mycena olivaceomarginata]|nr:phosphatidylserine decarboxylase-domain-containing protein [Mycena olivaceomarginata]
MPQPTQTLLAALTKEPCLVSPPNATLVLRRIVRLCSTRNFYWIWNLGPSKIPLIGRSSPLRPDLGQLEVLGLVPLEALGLVQFGAPLLQQQDNDDRRHIFALATFKPGKTTLICYGGWLPSSKEGYNSFFSQLTNKISDHRAKALPHFPSVAAFAKAINASFGSDPKMIDLWNQIFIQAAPQNKIKDFDSLLRSLDILVVQPPGFIVPRDRDGNPIGEPVGVPVYIILDLLRNTAAAAGSATMVWHICKQREQRGDFNSTYICPKPEEMDRGFTSWDHFFTREFQPDAQPIHSSSDPAIDAGIIVSACESTVLRLDHNVQLHDQFWLKGQKYSLYDMLDRNETATGAFIGGTVYQAFLSPADYHRWRSPVSGRIVNAVVVPGTCYAVLPDGGAEEGDPDFKPGSLYGAIIRSQSWLTQSATRAIIYIQADNPKIGLVGFIAVGMVEVSTCALAVRAGQQIEKGALVVPLWFDPPSIKPVDWTHLLKFSMRSGMKFNNASFGICTCVTPVPLDKFRIHPFTLLGSHPFDSTALRLEAERGQALRWTSRHDLPDMERNACVAQTDLSMSHRQLDEAFKMRDPQFDVENTASPPHAAPTENCDSCLALLHLTSASGFKCRDSNGHEIDNLRGSTEIERAPGKLHRKSKVASGKSVQETTVNPRLQPSAR